MDKNYIIMKKSPSGMDEMVEFFPNFTGAYAYLITNGLTDYYIAKILKFDTVTPWTKE